MRTEQLEEKLTDFDVVFVCPHPGIAGEESTVIRNWKRLVLAPLAVLGLAFAGLVAMDDVAYAHETCAVQGPQGGDIGCAGHHHVWMKDKECDGHTSYIEYSMRNVPDPWDYLTDRSCGGGGKYRKIRANVVEYRVCETRPNRTDPCTKNHRVPH